MSEVIPVRIPQETVNDDLVLIQQWKVTDGQAVQSGQVLVEVETSKSVFEITCPTDGFIRLNAASDQEVPIGKVLCYIGATIEAVDASLENQPTTSVSIGESIHSVVSQGMSSTVVSGFESHEATPADVLPYVIQSTRISRPALELIQSHGLSTSDFAGRGLVRSQDILSTLAPATAKIVSPSVEPSLPTSLPAAKPASSFRSAVGVPFRKEPLARSKRVETKVLSWSTQQAIRSSVTVMVPTVGRHRLHDADVDAAEKVVANLIHVCGELLRQFPMLNACCLDDQVLQYEQVHIGYALDAGHGLKVAVLRDADQQSVPSLLNERQRLISAYLNQSLLPADLTGATFTITDLSGSGVTTFDPLISEGQAGILGISGEFAIGNGQQAFHLILSFDHRLVEGRAAALFLSQLKDRVVAFEQTLFQATASERACVEACCARCGLTVTQATHRNHFLVSVAGAENTSALICTNCLQGR